MPYLSRDGTRLFYEDRGTGDPPIVLVHGIGTHAHFAAQIDHFQRGHRVIAPDLPGFGASGSPPHRREAITDHADAMVWLCEALGLRGPVLIGHSMGGAIAFEIAAARPNLPSAVVLLDPLPIFPLPALREQRTALVAALGGPDYRHALRGFAESRMFRPSDDPTIRARLIDDMCATPQGLLVATFASINDWDGEDLASHVKCPVLVITAGDGLPSDMSRTREHVARLELGRTVGTGHFAHVLSPEQVNAMIDRFLATSLQLPSRTSPRNPNMATAETPAHRT